MNFGYRSNSSQSELQMRNLYRGVHSFWPKYCIHMFIPYSNKIWHGIVKQAFPWNDEIASTINLLSTKIGCIFMCLILANFCEMSLLSVSNSMKNLLGVRYYDVMLLLYLLINQIILQYPQKNHYLKFTLDPFSCNNELALLGSQCQSYQFSPFVITEKITSSFTWE